MKVGWILEKLSSTEKLVIRELDQSIDSDRYIPNQELIDRLTLGKNPITSSSNLYNKVFPNLTNKKIFEKYEEKSSSFYLVTNRGWKIHHELCSQIFSSLPESIQNTEQWFMVKLKELMNLDEKSDELRTWATEFSYNLHCNADNFLKLQGKERHQKEYVCALGFITWNDIFQPELIKADNILMHFNLKKSAIMSKVYSLIKLNDWKILFLDNNEKWFICKDNDFWKRQYQYLFQFHLKEVIPTDRDKYEAIELAIKKIMEDEKIMEKLIDLINGELIMQIGEMKGHYWKEEHKKNLNWLIPRLDKLLLVKS